MQKLHGSASAFTKFEECPVAFVTNYDEDRKTYSRSNASDAGVLVHAALERFRKPENGYDLSDYKQLEAVFEQVVVDEMFAESIHLYARAKELLLLAFRMTQNHPTVPIQLVEIVATEQELVDEDGNLWKLPSWPMPVKGAIDMVGLIPDPKNDGKFILFIEDTKTGRPKTHEELTTSDPQPALYILYARKYLVPFLAKQGVEITRIVMSWTYVSDGTAVPMYEADFDHELTEGYVKSISEQILKFIEMYNEEHGRLVNFHGDHNDAKNLVEAEMNEWFEQYEKPNRHCSWCPRNNVCKTFEKMLRYNQTINLSGNIDWDAFNSELEMYKAIQSAAEKRTDLLKETVKTYLDQERLSSIPLSDGREIVANAQTRKKYRISSVIEILGADFVLANATVTDTAIKKQLALLLIEDAEKAKQIETALGSTYDTQPHSRPVLTRKADIKRKK